VENVPPMIATTAMMAISSGIAKDLV